MSSSQYIKIFNDTVLKQSILQGYESQRTDAVLGKFTMGELAFTRDTGRVFVGTYTDNKKDGDINYSGIPGGLLVGNKYYGASKGGKTLTHYPTYNENLNVYNGDYTFDVDSCSLLLFDNNIKENDTFENITLSNQTDKIYNEGFIRMRVLEPDNDTIKYDTSSGNHNVLKADFSFNRVSTYFNSKNWKTDNNKIEIKNIELDNTATCKLPSNVEFFKNTDEYTKIHLEGKKDIGIKFPTYLACVEENKEDSTYNISFKEFTDVFKITAGDGIKIEKSNEETEKPFIKISCTNSGSSNSGSSNPTINNTGLNVNGIYNDPWEINMSGAYVGVLTFDSIGSTITTNKYEGTDYVLEPTADNNTILSLGLTNSDTEFTNGMNKIKDLYSGGYYNVGLNYLNTVIPITSQKYDIKEWGEKISEDEFYSYLPFHAQSVILQVTTTDSTTTDNVAIVRHINENGPILFQSKTSKEATTIEVPLIPYGFWSIDTTDETDKGSVLESKTFSIYFTNCNVNLLGYRV